MHECEECGKKLGFIEGYRHPVMGKNYLLCRNCFDTVSESVEKYQKFISPYNDFFKNGTSLIEEIEKIERNII